MTIDELREEMESELTWRSGELRMLKNNLQFIIKEEDKSKYRKSLVVMLYANFEGFCKICLLSYVKYLNNLCIKRKNANKPELIASSMHKTFKLYDDKDRKNKIFKTILPDDSKLHTFCRRVDLIKEFDNFMEENILLEDEVINTESNLRSEILSKNLYAIGINPNIFENHNKNINKLVNLRNSIAHGAEKTGITSKEFEEFEKSILGGVMKDMIQILMKEAKLLK